MTDRSKIFVVEKYDEQSESEERLLKMFERLSESGKENIIRVLIMQLDAEHFNKNGTDK